MINRVILVGRLGRDPEMRYLGAGIPTAHFSIATNNQWANHTGAHQKAPEWHNVIMFNKLAGIANDLLKKGCLVYIEGSIQSRKYTGKDGVERTVSEIIGSELRLLSRSNDDNADNNTTNPTKSRTCTTQAGGEVLPTDGVIPY